MKIAILGTGAMGSIYAARFAAAGHEVLAVDTWQAHVAEINAAGLRVSGPDGDIHATKLRAATRLPHDLAFDLYVIATKAAAVADASRSIAESARPDATVLTIQNGLGAADRVTEFIPEDRVMLGVADGFGASLRSPGNARHTSMKLIRLGAARGGPDPRLAPIAEVWRGAGFNVEVFDDIERLIWEKLLCNVTLSGPCTVFGCTVAELRAHMDRWAIALGCMREAHAIGQAKGVRFSFEDATTYVTAFAEQLADAKPSMLQDFEAERLSELDAINGAIPPLGRRFGIATPYNSTITETVRALESRFTPKPS